MRYLLFPFAVLRVIYLRKRYKKLTLKWEYDRTNQHLTTLIHIRHLIWYYHSQFSYWGYFNPGCVTNPKYDDFFNWLFPPMDFNELDSVIIYNPEAVTYYHNKIFILKRKVDTSYSKEISKQLKEWRVNY